MNGGLDIAVEQVLDASPALFEGFQRYSDRWPRSGTTLGGRAYELPTSEHRIDASGFSSSPGLLRTPTAQLAVNGGSQHPDKRKSGGHGPTLADEVEHLLPTPTATPYGNNQSASAGAAVRPSLDSLEPTLLPTPRATDGTKGGPNQRGSSGDLMLPSAVQLLPTPSAAGADDVTTQPTLLIECVLPGCSLPVATPGDACSDCRTAFGDWIREVPDGAPMTVAAITERDRATIDAYVQQQRATQHEPVRRRNQICWMCEERRTCTRADSQWECDTCREVT